MISDPDELLDQQVFDVIAPLLRARLHDSNHDESWPVPVLACTTEVLDSQWRELTGQLPRPAASKVLPFRAADTVMEYSGFMRRMDHDSSERFCALDEPDNFAMCVCDERRMSWLIRHIADDNHPHGSPPNLVAATDLLRQSSARFDKHATLPNRGYWRWLAREVHPDMSGPTRMPKSDSDFRNAYVHDAVAILREMKLNPAPPRDNARFYKAHRWFVKRWNGEYDYQAEWAYEGPRSAV